MPSASLERARQLLDTPVAHLRGVGPRLAEKLARLEVVTVEDALYTLPHRYEDRREFRRIAQLRENRHEVFAGEILAAAEVTTQHRCAVKNISICPYFCGIEYLDTVLCCYPNENPLKLSG